MQREQKITPGEMRSSGGPNGSSSTAAITSAAHSVLIDAGRWGDDVCSVVTAPGQFALSRTSKNFQFDTPLAWQEAWTIAGRALDMWALPAAERKFVVPKADHFVVADSTSPAWIKGPPLATIGAHNFYRIN